MQEIVSAKYVVEAQLQELEWNNRTTTKVTDLNSKRESMNESNSRGDVMGPQLTFVTAALKEVLASSDISGLHSDDVSANDGRQTVEDIPSVPEDLGFQPAMVAAKIERLKEIQNMEEDVKNLPCNSDAKTLFGAYVKEIVDEKGLGWTRESNQIVVENMLRDGREFQCIVDALQYSPEPVDNAYYFVKGIQSSPGMKQAQQEYRKSADFL